MLLLSLKMKLKTLILLLLSTTLLHAQQINLKGTVIDARSNLPVAATTISIINKNIFCPADDEGKFSITNKGLANTDTVSFSCVGYQTLKMPVSDVLLSSIIKLNPVVNKLREVRVGYKPAKPVKVGSEEKSSSSWISYLPNMEQAMFMEGSANATGIIKSVGFYLGNGGSILMKGIGDVTAPFRIRLYGIKDDGTPGKELLGDVIVVSAKKNNAWFDVDISGYRVEAPEGGFFVTYSLLNPSFYEINRSYKNPDGVRFGSLNILTPHLGYTTRGFKEKQAFNHGYKKRADGIIDHVWHINDNAKYAYMIRATVGED
jgi:hypothetical protein